MQLFAAGIRIGLFLSDFETFPEVKAYGPFVFGVYAQVQRRILRCGPLQQAASDTLSLPVGMDE